MAERLRDAGLDPLTWAFARLLGRQLLRDVRELPGLPASHAWRPEALAHPRVLTKARCVGVVVSVLPRAERVEFLIDDGTGLVKAVLWSAPDRADVGLGDLVEVEGKLNANASLEGADPAHPRELRVTRMARVEDPNEEVLHWVQVMELTRSHYLASGSAAATTATNASSAPTNHQQTSSVDERWEKIGRDAFFHLRIPHMLAGSEGEQPHQDNQRERVSLSVLEFLLQQQREAMADARVGRNTVRITFSEALHRPLVTLQVPPAEHGQRAAIRDLRFAFHTMRSMGLLFLEDEETDIHEMLSYELALRPAIVEIVSGTFPSSGSSEDFDKLSKKARFTNEMTRNSCIRLVCDEQSSK